MRRSLGVVVAVGAALAMAGCGGQTTGTSNVATDSADLHATAHCDQGQSCTWYWQYWPASGPRSASVKSPVFGPIKGPTGNVALSQHITGLRPKTTYRWVFCGSPNNGGHYECVGPNGTFGSTTADPPPDYETLTTMAGWGIQTTPNPTGARSSSLAGVSCTYTTACTAVGEYVNSVGTTVTLAESWDGSNWTIQTTPNPTGARSSSLAGVSCLSPTACIAVGNYTDSAGTQATLAESWDGSNWTIQTTPNPTGARSSSLAGVSCLSALPCTAVGNYTDSAGTHATLAESWDGAAWTVQATPNPTGARSSSLSGVSCADPSVPACTAVGNYTDRAGTRATLAERWNGSNWTIQTTPNPAGASSSSLRGVWCTGACWAVGDYTSGGTTQTLAESSDGTGSNGMIQPTPNPTGASSSSLSGVWCISIRLSGCSAVGHYTSGGITLTLAESFIGSGWAIQPTPNPTGASSSTLVGLSCLFVPGPCTAVGHYTNGAGSVVMLVEGNPG